MIYIILDSTFYKQDLSFSTYRYKVLEELSKAGIVKVIIPDIIFHECKTELISKINKSIKTSNDSLKEIERICLVTHENGHIGNIIGQLNHSTDWSTSVADECFSFFNKTIDPLYVDFSHNAIKKSLNKYFYGGYPYKEVKDRKSIPDSIIYEEIIEIYNKYKPVFFISNDDYFRQSVQSEIGIKTYSKIDDFFEQENLSDKISEILSARYFENDILRKHNSIVNLKVQECLKEELKNCLYVNDLTHPENEQYITSIYSFVYMDCSFFVGNDSSFTGYCDCVFDAKVNKSITNNDINTINERIFCHCRLTITKEHRIVSISDINNLKVALEYVDDMYKY